MEDETICDVCGSVEHDEDIHYFDEQYLCGDCYSEKVATCEHCHNLIWVTDNAGDSETTLCQSCYDSNYSTCCGCDRVIHYDVACYLSDDSSTPYCDDCYDDRRDDYYCIQNYHYRPDPIFYGETQRYLGVELEIDNGCERHNVAKSLLGIANKNEERIYIKHDGSLENGMEIVTHPMTLAYHMNEMPWKNVVNECRTTGFYSHMANTCGLHVHVSRLALGDSYEEKDATIARILFFIEENWNELLKFSRRTESQLNRWASRYGRKDSPKETLDHAKSGGLGRYTCVNLNNQATIEFRIFRGTLKYNTVIATLQLVDELCRLAVESSDKYFQEMTWMSFVDQLEEEVYPELIQYLKERRLYVNEVVVAEGEL